MRADPALGLEYASVHEEQIRIERMAIEQRHEFHFARTIVYGLVDRVLGRIRVSDALRQRLAG